MFETDIKNNESDSIKLFDKLTCGEDYKKLYGALKTLVPNHILQILIAKPFNYEFDIRKVRYTFMFADISGFTALSNELDKYGSEGVELLTKTISEIFENFIAIIKKFKGSILKFGGDALLVMFLENLNNPAEAKLNAVYTAKKLIDFIKEYSVDIFKKKYSFRIHIGLNSGEIFSTVLDFQKRRKEYYIFGKTLELLSRAEACASDNEIVATSEFIKSLNSSDEACASDNEIVATSEFIKSLNSSDEACASDNEIVATSEFIKSLNSNIQIKKADENGGFYKILNESIIVNNKFVESGDANVDENLPLSKYKELCMKIYQYIPHPVLKSFINLNYRFDLTSANRDAVVVFINIIGFSKIFGNLNEHSCGNFSNILNNSYNDFMRLVQFHKGFFLRSDLFLEGEKLLVVFGAPVCYENYIDSALNFASEFVESIKHLNNGLADKCPRKKCICKISAKVGINYGKTFIGLVGSEDRKEYTVMGNTVNIAARLMSIAPENSIYCCSELFPNIKNLFHYKNQSAFLKGISGEYEFYQILNKKNIQPSAGQTAGIFHGRIKELKIIENIINDVSRSTHIAHIIGAAGSGKSAFVRKCRKMFIEGGYKIYLSQFSQNISAKPLHIWIQTIKNFLGETSVEKIKSKLLEIYKKFNFQTIPLIADLLNIQIEDNEITSSLKGEKRKKALFKSIYDLIMILCSEKTLIILEDLHWIDELSFELLDYFINKNGFKDSNKKICLMMAQRPNSIIIEVKDSIDGFYNKIEINSFTFLELKQYLQTVFPDRKISNKFAYSLFEKTGGNPFFISQVLTNSGVSEDFQNIPASVNAVILSQFDKFEETQKLLLLFAAVCGREFKTEVVDYFAKKMRFKINAQLALKLFRDNNFLMDMESDEKCGVYIFIHDLMRDALLETIAVSQKKNYHNINGDWLEKFESKDNAELLAYHYFQADNPKKAHKYLIESAENAEKRYSNKQAIEYYSQLIELFERGYARFPKKIKSAFIACFNRRGLLFRLIGEYDKALSNFYQMREWSKKAKDRRNIILSNNHIGSVYRWRGDQTKALEFCKEALDNAEKLGDLKLVASCANSLSVVYWYLGKYSYAIMLGVKSVSIRRAHNDPASVAHGLFSLGNCYTKIGNFSEARKCFSELLETSKIMDNKIGLAYAFDGIGYCDKEETFYSRALENHTQAFNIRNQTGDLRGLGYSYISFGEIMEIIGDKKKCEEYFVKAHSVIKSIQDENLLSDVLRCLAINKINSGDLSEAEKLINDSLEICRRINFTESIIKSGVVASNIMLLKGNYAESMKLAGDILKESLNSEMPESFIKSHILKAKARIKLNDSKTEVFDELKKASGYSQRMNYKYLKLLSDKTIIENAFFFDMPDCVLKNYIEDYENLLYDISGRIIDGKDKKIFLEKYGYN
ncbi:MAG TPA: adenylate/guanylate cyclase domain-containing protein [bacterium]|nr:adenylate/guanylate cyclase domain-containing protein [bacterium]